MAEQDDYLAQEAARYANVRDDESDVEPDTLDQATRAQSREGLEVVSREGRETLTGAMQWATEMLTVILDLSNLLGDKRWAAVNASTLAGAVSARLTRLEKQFYDERHLSWSCSRHHAAAQLSIAADSHTDPVVRIAGVTTPSYHNAVESICRRWLAAIQDETPSRETVVKHFESLLSLARNEHFRAFAEVRAEFRVRLYHEYARAVQLYLAEARDGLVMRVHFPSAKPRHFGDTYELLTDGTYVVVVPEKRRVFTEDSRNFVEITRPLHWNLLLLMLQRGGDWVTNEELEAAGWGDQKPTANTLASNLSLLNSTIEQIGLTIETKAKFGRRILNKNMPPF